MFAQQSLQPQLSRRRYCSVRNTTVFTSAQSRVNVSNGFSKLGIPPLVINYNSICGFKLLEVYVLTCLGICTLTIFVPEQMFASITSNGLSVSSYWPTCYLVFLRHQTSSSILRSCLAPWLEEISDRSDRGDPEESYSHYLSSDNVYAMILGGVAVCWASVYFR